MTIKRLPGDEAKLLRAALDSIDGMLLPHGLTATYTVDVADNSYTTSVQALGMEFDETWMRLKRFNDLEAILKEIVFAPDDRTRTIAIQRAGCMLDSRPPRIVL
jgi:hypothetical protein